MTTYILLFFRIKWEPIENEEERHKFEPKRTSDEKVTSKTVKPGTRASICGPQIVQRRTTKSISFGRSWACFAPDNEENRIH
jgi:hypothetical protein